MRSHLSHSGEYDILAPLGAGDEERLEEEAVDGEVEGGDEGEVFEQDVEEARGQREKSTAWADAD